jgi:glutamate/aspartate transport system substrate-binding protein
MIRRSSLARVLAAAAGGAIAAALAATAAVAAAGSPPAVPPSAAKATGAPAWPDALTGGPRRIKERHAVRIGYREHAIPFSYVGPEARPVGYTLELCEAVVATIAEDLGGAPLAIEYVPVTAQDRIARVVAGEVDLECGATTNTAERRAQVAFSSTIFVTGTRLAVPRAVPAGAAPGRAVRGIDDLAGRPVAVVRGTTTEAALRELDRRRALGLQLVLAENYRDALALIVAGGADALAADEALLLGLLVETGRMGELRLVGGLLSFEAYGIVHARDDPALADAVARTLSRLAASREIVWIYNRWFERPLPGRGSLGLPMGAGLRRSLELIGLPPD